MDEPDEIHVHLVGAEASWAEASWAEASCWAEASWAEAVWRLTGPISR